MTENEILLNDCSTMDVKTLENVFILHPILKTILKEYDTLYHYIKNLPYGLDFFVILKDKKNLIYGSKKFSDFFDILLNYFDRERKYEEEYNKYEEEYNKFRKEYYKFKEKREYYKFEEESDKFKEYNKYEEELKKIRKEYIGKYYKFEEERDKFNEQYKKFNEQNKKFKERRPQRRSLTNIEKYIDCVLLNIFTVSSLEEQEYILEFLNLLLPNKKHCEIFDKKESTEKYDKLIKMIDDIKYNTEKKY